MYFEEPGDAKQEEEQAAAERAQELAEANEDKEGELTMEHDTRGRGPDLFRDSIKLAIICSLENLLNF